MPINLNKIKARSSNNPPRLAECGACGCTRPVDEWLQRRRLECQFIARPKMATDSFHCGCQNDPDDVPF